MRWLRLGRRLVGPLVALLAGWLALALGRFLGARHSLPNEAPLVFPAKALVVTVVNVGHGEASWVKTPDGRFLVIGTGPQNSVGKLIASLRAAGAKQIDLLILPYPYPEAIGGVTELAAAFPIKEALDSGWMRINHAQDEAKSALARQGVPIRDARTDLHDYDLGGGTLQLHLPSTEIVRQTPAAANNSLIVRLIWGKTAFLWEGGLERAGEQALLGQGLDLSADWLRVARFGNAGVATPELLRAVSPSLLVLSLGSNIANFPSPETKKRLDASGAQLFRTDQSERELVFLSDGTSVTTPGQKSL